MPCSFSGSMAYVRSRWTTWPTASPYRSGRSTKFFHQRGGAAGGLTTYRQQHAEELGQQLACCRDVMDILLYVYRDKIEEFRRVNPVFFSDLQLYPEVMLSFESDRERQHKEFLDFMQRGVNEGFFRSDIDFELVGKMLTALGNYLMTNELYRTYSIEQLFRNMIFVTLRGLCTKKGADRLDTFL